MVKGLVRLPVKVAAGPAFPGKMAALPEDDEGRDHHEEEDGAAHHGYHGDHEVTAV